MRPLHCVVRPGLLAGLALFLLALPGTPQTPVRPVPRLEAVAETRLLMDGLAQSNFRGLERLLHHILLLETGKDNHLNMGELAADAASCFHTIDARHH